MYFYILYNIQEISMSKLAKTFLVYILSVATFNYVRLCLCSLSTSKCYYCVCACMHVVLVMWLLLLVSLSYWLIKNQKPF